MQAQVDNIHNEGERLYFTLKGVNVSVANALRRTFLSNIETIVFRGFPHEANQIDIQKNSTKFNNEYIKQRISCIPIMNSDDANFDNFIQSYQIIIDESNSTPEQKDITTEHIQMKNKNTGKLESKEFVKKYFPPDPITQEYIIICILYPNYNQANEENEHIHLIADLDKGCGEDNSCWNVVHHCAYENVRNESKIQDEASKIENPIEKQDFLLLDAQRIVIPNEFKMSIESLGIFTNETLVRKACEYIIQCLRTMYGDLHEQQKQSDPIVSYDQNETHMTSNHGSLHQHIQNTKDGYFSIYKEDDFYVLKLKKDDYTIGKLLEYYFYEMYERNVHFVGFKKKHPTEKEGYIYVKFNTKHSDQDTYIKVLTCIEKLIQMFTTIQNYFPLLD